MAAENEEKSTDPPSAPPPELKEDFKVSGHDLRELAAKWENPMIELYSDLP